MDVEILATQGYGEDMPCPDMEASRTEVGRGRLAGIKNGRARVSSPGWVGRLTTVDGRSAPADGLVSALPPALMDGGDFSVADVFTAGAYPHSDCGLLRMNYAEAPFAGRVAPAMGAVCGFGPGCHTVLLAGRPALMFTALCYGQGWGFFLDCRQKIMVAGIVADTPTSPKARPYPLNVVSGEAKALCGGNRLSFGRVDGEVAEVEGAVRAEEPPRCVVLHPAKAKDVLIPVVEGDGHNPLFRVLRASFPILPFNFLVNSGPNSRLSVPLPGQPFVLVRVEVYHHRGQATPVLVEGWAAAAWAVAAAVFGGGHDTTTLTFSRQALLSTSPHTS